MSSAGNCTNSERKHIYTAVTVVTVMIKATMVMLVAPSARRRADGEPISQMTSNFRGSEVLRSQQTTLKTQQSSSAWRAGGRARCSWPPVGRGRSGDRGDVCPDVETTREKPSSPVSPRLWHNAAKRRERRDSQQQSSSGFKRESRPLRDNKAKQEN